MIYKRFDRRCENLSRLFYGYFVSVQWIDTNIICIHFGASIKSDPHMCAHRIISTHRKGLSETFADLPRRCRPARPHQTVIHARHVSPL